MTRSRVGGRDSWITVILIDCARCGLSGIWTLCARSRTTTISNSSSSNVLSDLMLSYCDSFRCFVFRWYHGTLEENDRHDRRFRRCVSYNMHRYDCVGIWRLRSKRSEIYGASRLFCWSDWRFAFKVLLRYTRNNCYKFYLRFHSSVSSLAKTQRVNLSAHIILSIFPTETSQSAITVDRKTIGSLCLREIYISFLFQYFNSSPGTLYHRNSVVSQKWQIKIRTDYPQQRTILLFDQQYVSLESYPMISRDASVNRLHGN